MCSYYTVPTYRAKEIPRNTLRGGASPRSLVRFPNSYLTPRFSFSITDELETVCGLLSPPRSPRLLSPPVPGEMPPPSSLSGGATARSFRRCRHASEMSNPEMAVYLEKVIIVKDFFLFTMWVVYSKLCLLRPKNWPEHAHGPPMVHSRNVNYRNMYYTEICITYITFDFPSRNISEMQRRATTI